MSDVKEIIEGCRNNDRDSQERLFNRYKSHFVAIALRYMGSRDLAKDVVQDSFIKIFQNINMIDDVDKFDAWARRIVINTALSELKKSRASFMEFEENANIDPVTLSDKEIQLITEIDIKYLIELTNRLPAGYRTVFNLYLVEGYNHQEISDILDISENTSRTQLFKAKRYFRNIIQNLNIECYG